MPLVAAIALAASIVGARVELLKFKTSLGQFLSAGVPPPQKKSSKGFCRNLRDFYPNKLSGKFCTGFLGVLLVGHQEEKILLKSTAKFNQNLGASQPKSKLQRSGLEKVIE